MRKLLPTTLAVTAFVLSAALHAQAPAPAAKPAEAKAADKKPDAAKPAPAPAAPPKPPEKADVPAVKNPERHEAFVARAAKGDVDILFLGDSITAGWGKNPTWLAYYEPIKAVNFGIGGDRTQHVLWRITNGELVGIKPKVAVLMIGTNNSRDYNADEITAGITAIVKTLREKQPEMKVLLLGIFPRGVSAENNGARKLIKSVNEKIAKLDDGKWVHYLDIGDKFLNEKGELTKEVSGDSVHLTPKGYEIWAEAMNPKLEELLGAKIVKHALPPPATKPAETKPAPAKPAPAKAHAEPLPKPAEK